MKSFDLMCKVKLLEIANLLRNDKWKEADEQTTIFILQLTRRREKDWLRLEDIDRISCEYFYELNELWLIYSSRRFGFSVQEKIYTRVKNDIPLTLKGKIKRFVSKHIFVEGFRPKVDIDFIFNLHYYFGLEIGWIKKGMSIFTTELTYNEIIYDLNAPIGHLPHGIWFYFAAQKSYVPFDILIKNWGLIGALPKYVYELESRFYTRIKVCSSETNS
jgi:hypothetical protein